MSEVLRRCVNLGANGVINPGSNQDLRQNRENLIASRTRWVRLWADWPSLQPEGDRAPDAGGGAVRMQALDDQIRQANADGIQVILVLYRFPPWATETGGITDGDPRDAGYRLEDRLGRDRDPSRRKSLLFKLPPDLSPKGAWARWVRFLVERYSRNSLLRRAVVTGLELVNEPNLQTWPQQGPSTARRDPYSAGPWTVHRAVASMFGTAQTIVAPFGGEPLLVGPGTSDRVGRSRLEMPYDTFTTLLLDELAARGFRPGPRFAWSHHNYTDVEEDQGVGSRTGRPENRAAKARRLLVGRWAGWPFGNPADPGVLLTEGGARLTRLASAYALTDPEAIRAKQAELIERSFNRMRLGVDGAGIGMWTQYLFVTDVNFDSGLCDLDGTRRPAFSAWRGLPAGP